MDAALKKIGLRSNLADPCLYVQDYGQEQTLLLTFVDDILLLGTKRKLTNLLDSLGNEFQLKHLSRIKECLDMEVEKIRGKGYPLS